MPTQVENTGLDQELIGTYFAENTTAVTDNAGARQLLTNCSVELDLQVGDIVHLSTNADTKNNTADRGTEIALMTGSVTGTVLNNGTSYETANVTGSQAVAVVCAYTATAVGKETFLVAMRRLVGGTSTVDQKGFSVLHFRSKRTRTAETTDKRVGTLRPLGTGQSALDERGPFAPTP